MGGIKTRNRFYVLIGGMSTQIKILFKGGYYVEVSGYDGKKIIWEVVDNHVVDEGK